MTERRRFQVVAPDWGETHLTPEAVVAYVDGELAAGPHERAVRHLGHCPDCAAEVVDQRQARSALRGAGAPSLPSSLMSSLRAIPDCTELPGPPAGLSMSPDGELVSLLEPGARTSRRSRRTRLGAGAAFSGLALGALAFGASASGSPPAPAPGTPGLDPGGSVVARFAATPPPSAGPGTTTGSGAPIRNVVLPPADR